jgi:hypothetical protein
MLHSNTLPAPPPPAPPALLISFALSTPLVSPYFPMTPPGHPLPPLPTSLSTLTLSSHNYSVSPLPPPTFPRSPHGFPLLRFLRSHTVWPPLFSYSPLDPSASSRARPPLPFHFIQPPPPSPLLRPSYCIRCLYGTIPCILQIFPLRHLCLRLIHCFVPRVSCPFWPLRHYSAWRTLRYPRSYSFGSLLPFLLLHPTLRL